MTTGQMEQIKLLVDWLLDVVNRGLNIFLVEGVSADIQQLVKMFVVFMFVMIVLILVLVVLRLIIKIIEPLIHSLSQNTAYVFYLILAVLLLFFTSPVSFKNGCLALVCFIILELGYRYYRDKLQARKSREKEDGYGS